MSTTHPAALLYGGDDWILEATLLAADGQPLSLIDKTLEWSLGDQGALDQAIAPENVTIQILDAPNGSARIIVPSEITMRVTPGRYWDALRYTDTDGNTDTLWTGVIQVARTAFLALEEEHTMEVTAILAGQAVMLADATAVSGLG